MSWDVIQPVLVPVGVVGALGMAFGVLLAWFARKFAVKTDPAIEKVDAILPGVNCGACGLPGCSALAEAIVRGEAPVNACPVGGTRAWKEIGRITGQEVQEKEPERAVLICQGGLDSSRPQALYQGGVEDCRAAVAYGISFKACRYGCLGLGSCQRVCPFQAIQMDKKTGLPRVTWSRCTGCGKCVEECPRHVLTLVPVRDQVVVACTSLDRARAVKEVCQKGCIKCQLCIKACPEKAISLRESRIWIDRAKCTLCGQCIEKCPTQSIIRVTRRRKPEPEAVAAAGTGEA